MMQRYYLSQLQELEAESIFVIREVAANFERPAILFSGGKDSIVLTHLAAKAFYPAKIPFPLIHIDTGHNFPEVIKYRDKLVENLSVKLIVGSVQDAIDQGKVREEKGVNASRNALQTVPLLETIETHQIQAAMGGARRDEEKARAKERFFSHRDDFGQWDPKNQRPELWNLFNTQMHMGEQFRIFPISNWTELDIWQYIKTEAMEIPSIYYTHEREVIYRNGSILAKCEFIQEDKNDKVDKARVRFRTVGDMTCTGAVASEANNIDEIIAEIAAARETERGTRSDDKRSETAMEDRKKEGYF